MASHNHRPQRTYDRAGSGPNNHRSQSNGGRGNGKRGHGGKFTNNNSYYQNNSRHSHGAYQHSHSIHSPASMPTYPVGPPSASGVPAGAFPSMGTMFNTPSAWPFPGATTVGPGTPPYGQQSTATGYHISQHTSNYSIPPPHMTPATNSPLQTIPSSHAPSTVPGMNAKTTAVSSIDTVSSEGEQASVCTSIHAPTPHVTRPIQHSRATRTVPSSPVRVDRSTQRMSGNTLAMPTEKTHPLSKDHASTETSEELVQMLDHATLARLQNLKASDTTELQKTLYEAREKRCANQHEVRDKQSALLTQLSHAREHAAYYNYNTLKLYNAFVEKMTNICFVPDDDKVTVQRKAIECLKAATEHSERATKYRDQVELCRDALEATESMSLDLTSELVNAIFDVVVKALQRAATPDMLPLPEVITTSEVVMTVDAATTPDASIASHYTDKGEITSMTEVKKKATSDTHEPDLEPENSEKSAVEASATDSALLVNCKTCDHATNDTTLEGTSGEAIQPTASNQVSQNMHQATLELNNSNIALGNGWGNWEHHIKKNDEEAKRQARKDFERRGGQIFCPELKEMYKNRQGKLQQTVYKKIGDDVTTITANDSGIGLADQVNITESVENPVVSELTSMVRKDSEEQTETKQLEHSVSTLEEEKTDCVEPKESVESIEAIHASQVNADRFKNDIPAAADTSDQPVSSQGLTEQISVAALQTMIQVYIHEETPKIKKETQTNHPDFKPLTQEVQKSKISIQAPVERNVSKGQANDQTPKYVAPEEQRVTAKRQKHKQSRAKAKAKKKALTAAGMVEDSVSPVKMNDVSGGFAKGDE